MCFDFLYNSCMKYSRLQNSEGHYPKYSQALRYSASEACQILTKLEFCLHIYIKKETLNFTKICTVEDAIPCGWTD